jgi:hypothetical protein
MQIREGAYYRTQGGDVVGPMKRDEADMQYPWFSFEGTWTDTGLINVNVIGCDGDIISEVYVSDTPPADAPAPETKTLRDEFAIAIVMVLLSRPLSDNDLTPERCKIVWDNATAMMEARKK